MAAETGKGGRGQTDEGKEQRHEQCRCSFHDYPHLLFVDLAILGLFTIPALVEQNNTLRMDKTTIPDQAERVINDAISPFSGSGTHTNGKSMVVAS